MPSDPRRPVAAATDSVAETPEAGGVSFGRRTLIAGAAGAATALAVAPGSPAFASGRSFYQPIAPSLRLAETRREYGGPFGYDFLPPKTLRVPVAGRTVKGVTIPSDAVAAVLTVVAINLEHGPGYLTAYPSRTGRPNTSNLNYAGRFDTVNNLVTVKLGSDGAVEIFTLLNCDVVVDLVGVYRATSDSTRSGRFEPLGGWGRTGPSAKRLFSPEQNGVVGAEQVIDVDVTDLIRQGLISSDAEALAVNLTIDQPSQGGYASAYPFGEGQPTTSSLNYGPFTTRAASSIVRLGTDPRTGRRGFHVFLLRRGRFFVDATGSFTGPAAAPSTAGQFVPLTPERVLETRSASPWMRGIGGQKRLFAGWTRRFSIPPSIRTSAGAVAANLTLVDSMGAGYLTLLPARTPRQLVSNVNAFGAGQVSANHAISLVSREGLEVYSSSGASVVCDLVGYYHYVHGGVAPTVQAFPDPAPQSIDGPYTMRIPRTGLTREMAPGPAWLVDGGRVWHWSGTGRVGQGAMIGAFAHRTDAGGPFRNLHWLSWGDTVTLETRDLRRYTYRYVGRELTDSNSSRILTASARHPGEVLSLIACSKTNWLPTSLQWRIVVRLELVGWEDISPTPY